MYARAAKSSDGATVEGKKPNWRQRQVNAQTCDKELSIIVVDFKSRGWRRPSDRKVVKWYTSRVGAESPAVNPTAEGR